MLELLNGSETKGNQELTAHQQDGTQIVGCYCGQRPPDLNKKQKKDKNK